MTTPWKTLSQVTLEVLDEVERVGLREAIGLEVIPEDRVVDRDKCECGSGCESVLECEFWYWIRKTDAMERKANRQVSIGNFRVDCLFDCDGKKVVVELDGQQFHQDPMAELNRDDWLLRSVDSIIHVPYSAMHFYPHATFEVLSSWYPRFKLRGVDMFCMPVSELRREIQNTITPDGDIRSEAAWLEWAEPNFELWGVAGGVGWVGSPKAWLKRWNVKPITMRERGFSRRIPESNRAACKPVFDADNSRLDSERDA